MVQVALIPIPFVFYKWGSKIRARSPLIRQMREDQERSEKRAAKARKLQERRLANERGEVVLADENGGGETEKEGAVKTALPVMTEKE